MIVLEVKDYGRVEVEEKNEKLVVRWKLERPVRLGYNAYSAEKSIPQRSEDLPAGEGSDEYPLLMPSEVSDTSAVILNVAIRTADGRTQLKRSEESIRRSAQAIRRDAATQTHADAWEAPPGATANHL